MKAEALESKTQTNRSQAVKGGQIPPSMDDMPEDLTFIRFVNHF